MIRVLIAEHRPELRGFLCAALAADDEIETLGSARDGMDALRLAHSLRPDIVLLAAELPILDGFAASERLTALGLPLETIVLTADLSADTLRRAMRAGARECLPEPVSAAELCAAVSVIHTASVQRRSPAAAQPPCRVVAVSGAKGGVGKTTLAVNLAAALAADTGEPTALLDLYTQFGDAALLLNITPRRTLADWVSVSDLDQDLMLLEDHLERHPCGLRLLGGASAPIALDALSPDCLSRTLSLLRPKSRFIVLDVPPVLHPVTRQALAEADTALLVANLFDLTTLADTRHWLDAVDLDTIKIVLNRVSPSNRLQLPDITRTLGRPVDYLVPNDGKLVPASINAGVPFVLSHPNSKAAGSVYTLARSLV